MRRLERAPARLMDGCAGRKLGLRSDGLRHRDASHSAGRYSAATQVISTRLPP